MWGHTFPTFVPDGNVKSLLAKPDLIPSVNVSTHVSEFRGKRGKETNLSEERHLQPEENQKR